MRLQFEKHLRPLTRSAPSLSLLRRMRRPRPLARWVRQLTCTLLRFFVQSATKQLHAFHCRRGVRTITGVLEAVLFDTDLPSDQQVHCQVLPELGPGRRGGPQVTVERQICLVVVPSLLFPTSSFPYFCRFVLFASA